MTISEIEDGIAEKDIQTVQELLLIAENAQEKAIVAVQHYWAKLGDAMTDERTMGAVAMRIRNHLTARLLADKLEIDK